MQFGIYENASSGSGSAIWTPRLQQIASGGFSVVMSYGLLNGHISDITAYINAANSLGLKIIVALHDPAIWKTATYSTVYPALYADSGNAATGIAFMQYIVGQVKGLAGVWGYYVGDEVLNTDHATLKTYTDAVKTADSTHPRFLVTSSSDNTKGSFYNGTSPLVDCCDVAADDYYPIGDTAVSWPTASSLASGIQSTCNANSLASAVVLQAQSWQNYFPPARCSPYPFCAPWPNASQESQVLGTVLANMSPKLVMWFSYFDILTSDFPAQHWNDLVKTIGFKMAATLVQSNTATSAAAGPATITPTLSSASTAGNLLLMAVVVTASSGAAITTPAGWTLIRNSGVAGTLQHSLFALPNNAGGITSVPVTITATGGGAVASIFEFSGLGNSYALDTSVQGSNTSSAAYSTPALPATTLVQELIFNAIGFSATTLTPNNSGEFSSAVGAGVSTNGVPNAQLACFWGVSLSNGQPPAIAGTFGVATASGRILASYNIQGAFTADFVVIGGVSGRYVGNYSGSVGG